MVDAQAYELLAILELKEHDRVDLMRFRLASRTGPPNWRIEKKYIEVLDQTGDTPAAVRELSSCLKTQWYRAESWQLLSRLFSKAGATREGMEALEQAKDYDVHLMETRPRVPLLVHDGDPPISTYSAAIRSRLSSQTRYAGAFTSPTPRILRPASTDAGLSRANARKVSSGKMM